MARPIEDSTFAVAVNGANLSPPASGLVEYLLERGARQLTTVFHPLEPEHPPVHEITVYQAGREVRRRAIRLPSRPPYTYVFDPFVPPVAPRVDAWFGFNSLASARGLFERRIGRVRKVIHWCVDFVPDRFGRSPITRAYDTLDRLCCQRADARFELTEPALEARSERHRLTAGRAAPTRVVPIGAWLDRIPRTPEDGWQARRVVFMGHLAPRMGLGVMVDALAQLAARSVDFVAEIAGAGPLGEELRARAAAAGLDEKLRFLGFIADLRDVETFLARGSVGIAPYDPKSALTPYADPGKIKAYLAAGLPTVTTSAPFNARELAADAGAEVVPFEPGEFASAIERLMSPDEWIARRRAALAYSEGFDWNRILGPALESLGFR